jgi:hypothetical protein
VLNQDNETINRKKEIDGEGEREREGENERRGNHIPAYPKRKQLERQQRKKVQRWPSAHKSHDEDKAEETSHPDALAGGEDVKHPHANHLRYSELRILRPRSN